MKKKKYLILIAALTISAAFLLNGCGKNNNSTPNSTSAVSADAELNTQSSQENATTVEGNVQLTSRWYQADSSKLAAKITFQADGKEIASGTIDSNGKLAALTLPANKELTCTVTDTAGTVLAESGVTFKLSPDYTTFSVYPADSEKKTQTMDVPASKSSITAAMFLTSDKTVECVNLTSTAEQTDSKKDSSADSQKSKTDNTKTDSSKTSSTAKKTTAQTKK